MMNVTGLNTAGELASLGQESVPFFSGLIQYFMSSPPRVLRFILMLGAATMLLKMATPSGNPNWWLTIIIAVIFYVLSLQLFPIV